MRATLIMQTEIETNRRDKQSRLRTKSFSFVYLNHERHFKNH